MRAELLIRRQQFSGSSDLRSVGLAQGKTEQITSAALHLQIWNIKQNKKIMFSPFLCKSDISARLPADHRYLPGLLLRQQPPPPPLSHRLFIICYQQTSEPPKKSCTACVENLQQVPATRQIYQRAALSHGCTFRAELHRIASSFSRCYWTEIESAVTYKITPKSLNEALTWSLWAGNWN